MQNGSSGFAWAELHNIDPKQVDITVTDDTITLEGKTKQEEEEKGRTYYRRELRYGAFSRTLPLAAKVKSAEAEATYKEGILENPEGGADEVHICEG